MWRVGVLCLFLVENAVSVPIFAQSNHCCGGQQMVTQMCPDNCYNNVSPYNQYQPYMQQYLQNPYLQQQQQQYYQQFMQQQQQPQQQNYYQNQVCNPYCQGFPGCCEWSPNGQMFNNPVGFNNGCYNMGYNRGCIPQNNQQQQQQQQQQQPTPQPEY